MSIDLQSLIGEHLLYGCDIFSEEIKEIYGENYEYCQVICFNLDGISYTVIEDPSDGYRSYVREVKISTKPIKNTFPPVQVLGSWGAGRDEILELRSIKTGEIVLRVGTENSDDYYPCFIGQFFPQAIGEKVPITK